MRVLLRRRNDNQCQSVDNAMSVDECLKRICELKPGCITRRAKKQLESQNDFIILEVYRCMPLLGDENKVPNWEVHIAHYRLVFINSAREV